MPTDMTERIKHSMLDGLLQEGEHYYVKMWGEVIAGQQEMETIKTMGGIIPMHLGGAIKRKFVKSVMNECCYLGVTDNRIIFVVVKDLNSRKVKTAFEIPLVSIIEVKNRKSLIFGKKIIKFETTTGIIKLTIPSKEGLFKREQEVDVNRFMEMIGA